MEPVPVVMNHGRWLVGCPRCGAANLAQGLTFVCGECGNGADNPIPIAWPPATDRIDQLMQLREVANRNFNIGETVDDIERENEAHLAEIVLSPEERDLLAWHTAELANAEVKANPPDVARKAEPPKAP